jgi:2-methylcitrate dehydratase PrpD
MAIVREEDMRKRGNGSVDRRLFLGGTATALMAAHRPVLAQQPAAEAKPANLSDAIARFVTGFDLKAAPARAIETARTAFVDTVGVTLAGSRSEPATLIGDMVRAEGAAPAVSVIGQSYKTSPQLAALADGVASHALDFDFTFGQGQLAAPLIPALLPLAESAGATPAEVLAAFIVGFEVIARFTRANPNHNGVGLWHGTSTIGTIGAATACARLLKAPAQTIPDILGISVSLASGVNANYGTMTKPLHAGQAARNAIMAAELGRHGFTANRNAIEGRGGFVQAFARGLTWRPEAFDDLGQRYDLVDMGIRPKRYPCGGVIHTGIDGALMIRDELGARAADIAAIKAGISKYAQSRAGEQYPANTEAAKFNLQYVVAYALAHGAPKLASFDEAAIKDERVRALATMISVALDPEFAEAKDGDYPTRLAVSLKDGTTIEKLVVYASGTPHNPMSPAQMQEKFFDCAAQAISAEAAKKIFAVLSTLGEQNSFGDFWALLRRG